MFKSRTDVSENMEFELRYHLEMPMNKYVIKWIIAGVSILEKHICIILTQFKIQYFHVTHILCYNIYLKITYKNVNNSY